jgi:hypothetical protein
MCSNFIFSILVNSCFITLATKGGPFWSRIKKKTDYKEKPVNCLKNNSSLRYQGILKITKPRERTCCGNFIECIYGVHNGHQW